WVLHGGGEDGHRRRVGAAGLEHVDRPTYAARLEVDQAVDVAAERVGEEGAGADEAQFLTLVEQQDYGASERSVFEDRGDLQQSRYADPVVGGAGPHGRAVVVGVEQQCIRVADIRTRPPLLIV